MIEITQGDQLSIQLQATSADGTPVDLSGATFVTQFLGPQGVVVSIPNGQHTVTDMMNGFYTVALQSSDTTAIGLGNAKDIISTITQGSSVITYRGIGILTVFPPVPQQ